jgi:hypothetical protein
MTLRPTGPAALVLMLATGCIADLPDAPPPPEDMQVGERRELELQALRLDVSNFRQTLRREDLLALPESTQRRLWLLDLDLAGGPGSPRFIDNALAAIADTDPATLDEPSRNMQAILSMTPDSADLSGTSFENLVALAPLVGISQARVLADLADINAEDSFLDNAIIGEVILDLVVGTHPNARRRLGPRTPDNPEGIYEVAPRSLPVTLADAASDFGTFAQTFGPWETPGEFHPGFVVGRPRAALLGPDFSITVTANANALPYKGVDLRRGVVASVNSIGSQIQSLFDFEDPNWLLIDGLAPGTPVINEISFRLTEDAAFHPSGLSPLPRPRGSGQVWRLPPWTLEHIVAEAAYRTFANRSITLAYQVSGNPDPLVVLDVLEGWASIRTAGGLGEPPPAAYLWDVVNEIAQVRVHDGGIPEGEADAVFTLSNIPVGIDTRVIEQTVRDNLASDPFSLLDIATRIIDTTSGDADFYYVQRRIGDERTEDWLVFIGPEDIALDTTGRPVRPYAYTTPGFFADDALSQRVSQPRDIGAGLIRQVVVVEAGQRLYLADDENQRYAVTVGARQNRATLPVTIERLP